MDTALRSGTLIKSDSGNAYKVMRLLGAGGQGEVYEAQLGSRKVAIKWYFQRTARRQQKEVLANLIRKGTPDPSFLWPEDLISEHSGQTFGYVMPLRENRYKGIVDLMKRRAEPSFLMLCRAAFNLTRGYRILHSAGYSYSDISFGNVFFDPDTGKVLICDNDNVAPNASETIAVDGTPRFMAPEIVIGKANPSRNTDLYSLAVLLFYMFMMSHPLEGKIEAGIHVMDMNALRLLFGTNPVFIYDPSNNSNRPVPGYHDNAIIYWEIYPQAVRNLFITAFTTGISQPNRRITETQWLDAIVNLITGIILCTHCGAEMFYDESMASQCCWNCKKEVPVTHILRSGKNRVALTAETKLYKHHTDSDYDIETITASVVQNPNDPSLWGIRNETVSEWIYTKADGTKLPVASGRAAAIAKGARIDFNKTAFGEID